ncbi:hypothetical protein ACCUM_2564 [Candidatus Accumulibacter phosphatis]|uniref:Uncharacterized protein n=1 Tax=Candidatus Accumulibacter phosphatis TaxID=327160 RepID=A0A5S4EQV4_9PROT|nr:hypothetical protein ACCUM_2564 [Candidatus Accumulibacter phosphatis]
MVRTRAGFHTDQTRRQLRHQLQPFVARNLRLDENGLAVLIHTMHAANTFLARSMPTVTMLMDFPFRGVDVSRKFHHGTRCRSRLPPQPRDGELPFIRWASSWITLPAAVRCQIQHIP